MGDGSYVFTLEKRGYVKVKLTTKDNPAISESQAGKFTPESACEHPAAVKQLAIEFARAGADVTQTFTYGSTEGMLEARLSKLGHSLYCREPLFKIILIMDNNTQQSVIIYGYVYGLLLIILQSAGVFLHSKFGWPGVCGSFVNLCHIC